MSNRARLLVELALNSAPSAVASHQVAKDDNINNLANKLDDVSTSQRTESTDEPDPFHESDNSSEYLPTETDTDSENVVGNQEDHQVIPDGRAKQTQE